MILRSQRLSLNILTRLFVVKNRRAWSYYSLKVMVTVTTLTWGPSCVPLGQTYWLYLYIYSNYSDYFVKLVSLLVWKVFRQSFFKMARSKVQLSEESTKRIGLKNIVYLSKLTIDKETTLEGLFSQNIFREKSVFRTFFWNFTSRQRPWIFVNEYNF